ncbi:MAG TPA: DUF4403 family protein [Thermoanaerobaculia bacterium]|nr:DUF4403 family protein [Thermoanaerobaculia bacterium]
MPRVVVSDMSSWCRSHTLRVLFPLIVIVACAGPAVPAPQPAASVPAVAPPPPEISTIVVPIRTNLAALSPEIEARVPKTFNGNQTERGIDVRYDIARDPIALQMIGAGLHASTTVKYALEACRGRFPCISCGYGEARREAEIRLQTKLDWDPSWRLRSSTRLLPVHYARPCQVTWLDIDITRRFVAPAVEQQLGAAARIIDASVPSLANIRPQAQQIWTSLQTPTELAPRTWLMLDPSDVALTPISGSGAIATSTLVLRAQTRVVVGEKPVAPRKPLPALRVASASPGALRVPADLELPYAEAARLVTTRKLDINGKPLTIESLRVAPASNGRVLVEAQIDYRGGLLRNYRGASVTSAAPVATTRTEITLVNGVMACTSIASARPVMVTPWASLRLRARVISSRSVFMRGARSNTAASRRR